MNVFELEAVLTLDSSKYDQQLSDAANRSGTTMANAKKAHAAITGAAVAGLGAIAAFGASSVKTGMEFDKSMSQVAATMGTTVDQIGDLRDYAMEMGRTTAFSATQAADALNFMALAGYDAQTSMEMLPNVLNLAAAGGMELAAASDMITDSQSALGLTLEETSGLVDKMAMAASKSNTSVAQLGDAILTVGGTAKSLAGGTTELATALGILADNGIKGAEGGTALRNIILSLSSPTDQAAKLMQELGLQVFDAEGNMRPLNDTFNDLNAALSTMTEQERTNVLSELFNKVDLKSANALLANSGERFTELSGYIDDAANAAENMANVQLDNLAGDITLLQSAFEGLQISVSDRLTPVFRAAVQGLTDLIENAGQIAGAIAPAAAAFGAFAIAINVVPAINAARDAILGFNAVLAENPIVLAIALMAGLAVAAYNLVTHFTELYTEADKAAEGIRNLNRATESGVSGWVEQENAAKESMSGVQSSVESAASGVSDALGAAGADSGQAYRENLTNALSGIDADLATQISAAMDGTAAAVDSYSSQMGAAGENAASQYANAWSGGEVANAVTGAMTSATEAATTATQAFTNVGQNIATQLASSISAGAGTVSSSVRNVVATAIMAGNAATGGATAIGANIARGIAAGISSGSGAIAAAARSAVQAAVAAAKAAAAISSPSKLFRDEVGVFIGLGVAEGIEDSEDKSVQAAKTLAEKTYQKSAEWLRRQTKFNRLSLAEQLEVWQEIQSGYIKESKQWIQAEEEIFDLREKIQSDFASDVEKLWKNITDAQDKYADALEKRIDDIAGAYKLFDDVQDREAVSGQELTDNLTRQVNVLSDFYGGLDALAARGVSGDLVEEIRDMGPKAVDNLDALLAMTDEELSEYADLYGQKQAFANAQALKELQGLKAETDAQVRENMQSILDLYDETAPTLGEAFTDGLAKGILDGVPDVVSAAVEASRAALEAASGTMFGKQRSFSRSGLGKASAGMINSVAQHTAQTGGTTTINLMTPDGGVLARYIFNPLKEYAAAKGQPIVGTA